MGTIPKFNRKFVETDKIDTSNTHVHDLWLGTATPIQKRWRG
jgi:hypothetical protein